MKLWSQICFPGVSKLDPVALGLAEATLTIRTLAGTEIHCVAADGPWSEESILAVCTTNPAVRAIEEAFGADVFLGDRWIGSTEI